MAWALRRTAVRNSGLSADNCNAPRNPGSSVVLNRNHNHEMKEIFKSTATRASCGAGPFHDFYQTLLAKGMKPEMARRTLVRKIAAITLTLWKRGERFDAEQLKARPLEHPNPGRSPGPSVGRYTTACRSPCGPTLTTRPPASNT